MSAYVLLTLINELRKRDEMRGLPSILSLFRNEFNKFNNTGARMLSLVYMHNLHPGAKLLPGAKLHPGVSLHPLCSVHMSVNCVHMLLDLLFKHITNVSVLH